MEKFLKSSFFNGLSGLDQTNVEQIFERNYWRWQFAESDEVRINGELVSKAVKAFILGSTEPLNSKTEITVSETKQGYSLTRLVFAKKELQKLERLKSEQLDFITLDRVDLMINYCKSILEPKSQSNEFFTTQLNQVRMKAIHKYLSDEKYINVDIDSWLYWFGLKTWTNKKMKPQKIKWLAASYILSNVVFIICDNFKNDTERTMQNVFTLQKGGKFQNKTTVDRTKKPYKTLYEKIEMAEHSI